MFLETSMYTGVAPVPVTQYRRYMMAFQAANPGLVSRAQVREAFSHLVLSQRVLDQLGPAVNARHSLFVYGPPGNGKTVVSQAIGNLLYGDMWIPHALDVDGHIIQMFDPVNHEPLPPAEDNHSLETQDTHDRRWILCRRPLVTVGGELTLDSLDLAYSPVAKFYRAPIQLVANGGALVIDDFGRQKCSPHALLNRWITPLESRVDFLTLQSGQKVDLPFMVLVIFATNIKPAELVDEAFLRRIHYKVFAESPTAADFTQIFQNACRERDLEFDPEPRQTSARAGISRAGDRNSRMSSARSDRSGAVAGALPWRASPADRRTAGGGVRQLLRGRNRRRFGPALSSARPVSVRTLAVVGALLAAVVWSQASIGASTSLRPGPRSADASRAGAGSRRRRPRPSAIQITSPLGRTGMAGSIRIVARITADKETPVLSPVQFFVDGQLVGEDKNGAPYAIEWTDNNPFEQREISVQVQDDHGNVAKDRIVLKPIDVSQSTSVQSVLLEPQVLDRKGRPVNGLTLRSVQGVRGRRAAGARHRQAGRDAGDLHAAHRHQRQHAAADRVRARGGRQAAVAAPPDRHRRRRAVCENARRDHRPDPRRGNDRRRDRRDQADRRHGDSRLPVGGRRAARHLRGPARDRRHHRRLRRAQRPEVRARARRPSRRPASPSTSSASPASPASRSKAKICCGTSPSRAAAARSSRSARNSCRTCTRRSPRTCRSATC